MSYPVCPQCGFAAMFRVCGRCGVDRDRPPVAPTVEDLAKHAGQHVAVDHDGTVIDGDDSLETLLERLAARDDARYPATIIEVPADLFCAMEETP